MEEAILSLTKCFVSLLRLLAEDEFVLQHYLILVQTQIVSSVRAHSTPVPYTCFTFMQHCIGRLVPRHGLLAEVLVGLGETLHLAEASVEGHGGVGRVFCHVQVGRPAQLLLNYQCLLQ